MKEPYWFIYRALEPAWKRKKRWSAKDKQRQANREAWLRGTYKRPDYRQDK